MAILKKVLLAAMLLTISGLSIKRVNANVDDYQSFANITLSSGKMLKKYDSTELKSYIKASNKRKFSGWRISYINKEVRCNFISKTVFSIYNSGTTPIKYELNTTTTKINKTSISCTGSISYSIKGDIKKFKNGLDTSLKIENTTSQSLEVKSVEKFELIVDPMTRVIMYFKGSGYLTNGYAQQYSFWARIAKGGFEYFTVTDIYPKIEKVAL